MGSWRTGDGVPYVWQLGAFYRAMETGDFADAAIEPCTYSCSMGEGTPRRARAEALGYDLRRALASMAEASAAGAADRSDLAEVHYRMHAASGDWDSAESDAEQMAAVLMAEKGYAEGFRTTNVHTRALPLLAYAQARRGEFAKASITIDATPADCYNCLRVRGQIDALQKNWSGAQYWFEQAVKQGPSLPFVYSDWGAMLMAKGNLDAAIAKFEIAHAKGPHFAEALDLWGEALIAKNRSDLALAKFEEANKYAPNWGRLHLKWGEALRWSGDKAGAKEQFAVAAGLDLTAAEKTELASTR